MDQGEPAAINKILESSIVDLSLSHAARGWFVFPCKPDKKPYTINGKDDATRDPDTIREWWQRWPAALVGIYCEKSGIFGLDIDLDNSKGINGFYSLAHLIDSIGNGQALLPQVGPVQNTPRGGQHYIFKLPQGVKIPNKTNAIGPGLDLRSNGYILTGSGYTWLLGHGPDTQLTDAPAWLLDAISEPKETAAAGRSQAGDNGRSILESGEFWLQRALGMAVPGTRNQTGFWLACQLRDSGISLDQAEVIAHDYAISVPGNDYSEREAIASIRSAYNQTPRQPARRNGGNGAGGIETRISMQYINGDQEDRELIIDEDDRPSEQIPQAFFIDIPPLPDTSKVDPQLGRGACKWLDDYIAFSRKWSPRAFDGFHTACGLWLLSSTAARRVQFYMGKTRYTNLYLAMTARTSLYAKTTTAEIPLQINRQAGLSWQLAADNTTPQKFISDLTTRLVNDYDSLNDEQKLYARLRVGMAGQRGWFYDEFGQHVAAMMKDNGFMADFRGLLRRLDDTPDRYEYGSIARGSDVVERPYLALLANLTPDDLRPFARRGAALWGDGFLARFALITPPEEDRRRDRFPTGERMIDANILTPLVEWHKRLGLPDVDLEDINDSKGQPTGSKRVDVTQHKTQVLSFEQDVYEAFYAYDEGLLDLIQRSSNHDLDGNYARLSEKALRVAALLASMSGAEKIEMRHWARALEIVEGWRAGLHELYYQINQPDESQDRQMEEKLLTIVQRLGGATAVDCTRYVYSLSTSEASRYLDGLVAAGLLITTTTRKHTKRYKLYE